MGLDVYLYRYDDYGQDKATQAEYDRRTEAIWEQHGGFENAKAAGLLEQVQLEEGTIAAALGMVTKMIGTYKSYVPPGEQKIDRPSALYPKHLYRVGYFRSSYNPGGLNSVLSRLRVPGLYEIFEHEEQESEFQPDWALAKAAVVEAIETLQDKLQVPIYDAMSVADYSGNHATSAREAIDRFEAEHAEYEEARRKKNGKMDSYSNKFGDYFQKGVTIYAAIQGKNVLGNPCTYLITKGNKEYQWYLQALQVVEETIDWVLAQPDRAKYWLRWSA